jgi:hypothetical protein
MKRLFLPIVLMSMLALGLFVAQSIHWFRLGKEGKRWVTDEGYTDETLHWESRSAFPFTVEKTDYDDEPGCME